MNKHIYKVLFNLKYRSIYNKLYTRSEMIVLIRIKKIYIHHILLTTPAQELIK